MCTEILTCVCVSLLATQRHEAPSWAFVSGMYRPLRSSDAQLALHYGPTPGCRVVSQSGTMHDGYALMLQLLVLQSGFLQSKHKNVCIVDLPCEVCTSDVLPA